MLCHVPFFAFAGWTELMGSQLKSLRELGVSRGELLATVAAVPRLPEALAAVRLAHEKSARQVILSDANTVFIEALERQKRCVYDVRM